MSALNEVLPSAAKILGAAMAEAIRKRWEPEQGKRQGGQNFLRDGQNSLRFSPKKLCGLNKPILFPLACSIFGSSFIGQSAFLQNRQDALEEREKKPADFRDVQVAVGV
jgi:hypothetical protein